MTCLLCKGKRLVRKCAVCQERIRVERAIATAQAAIVRSFWTRGSREMPKA